MHFFGDCTDEFGDVETIDDAQTECEVIAAEISVFEHQSGIDVETILTDWPGTTELNTRLAAGDAPTLSVLHGTRIPNYASRGLLTPLDDLFAQAGIDLSDLTPTALDYVTYNGQIFGLPLDVHGGLWHINVDVWAEAGLVDESGAPIIPTNEEEFLAAAAQMMETTGKPIVTLQTNGANGTVWPVTSLIFQQGGSVADAEGNPTLNTPEAQRAVSFMANLLQQGYATPLLDYSQAEGAFINGDSGSFFTGTWAVSYYDAQVADPESPLKNYAVVPFPAILGEPAVWSNAHTWVIPQGVNADPASLTAAVEFLKLVYDNNDAWTRPGATAVRQTVLESPEYLETVHRQDYASFAEDAQAYPRIQWVSAYETIIDEAIQSVYLGESDVETALANAQARLEDTIAFSSF
jgi:multiple sugar transport system substrate-binding protein